MISSDVHYRNIPSGYHVQDPPLVQRRGLRKDEDIGDVQALLCLTLEVSIRTLAQSVVCDLLFTSVLLYPVWYTSFDGHHIITPFISSLQAHLILE